MSLQLSCKADESRVRTSSSGRALTCLEDTGRSAPGVKASRKTAWREAGQGALAYIDAWSYGLLVDRMRIQSSQERLQVWEEGVLDGKRKTECLFCRAED